MSENPSLLYIVNCWNPAENNFLSIDIPYELDSYAYFEEN